ncbi:cell envelope integrity protein TolA [Desulfatitalea tepidiphila]|uniref:cell envelope integrity protein TolA n=1 Tax=Desulfatitalea tepidiphila TaxID=1185843 RepID=UPI0009F8DDEF|nr:TonB C-terminal domain-containing protein [Desulfatitalea tepidiphila]
MISGIMSYPHGEHRNPFFWPFLFSFLGHILLFAFILYTPKPDVGESFFPSVIDVQMVDVQATSPSSEKSSKAADEKVAPLEETEPEQVQIEEAQPPKPAAEAEVSLAPATPKTKTALKYKTLKTQEVLKSTLERIEKKVEVAPPRPLEDTIKRLREKVEKEGRPDSAETTGSGEGTATSGKMGFGGGGKQEGELIDMYRLEIAYAIQKNWAYADQLGGDKGHLVASIVMKVLPDGRIEDIFFTDRSGNPYLDDSAYKAIIKSSPVRPHPDGLNRPFIEMGLRFTPKGVQ